MHHTTARTSDSLRKPRLISHSIVGAGAVGSLLALQQVWYKPYQSESFHFFNDGHQWLQMDKCGHAFSAYMLSQECSSIYAKAYGSHSIWWGAGVSFAYLSALEVMDGFSSGWGFSGYDMLANGIGVGLSMSQTLFLKKPFVIPKFSFSPSSYAKLRPEVLGSTFSEQILKDYNGQTYWLSMPLSSAFNMPKKLEFLCLSLGYSADAKIVGDQNDYQGYRAQREFILSMDVDLSKIARNKPKLNKVLCHLNYLKMPFSGLIFKGGQCKFAPIYF